MFPYESNARMCRDNVTQGANAVTRLVTGAFSSTYDLSTTTGTEYLTTDLSYLLKIPYGVSFSCYYGYEDISYNTIEEAEKDGVITE